MGVRMWQETQRVESTEQEERKIGVEKRSVLWILETGSRNIRDWSWMANIDGHDELVGRKGGGNC
jgi:hypothetical protein